MRVYSVEEDLPPENEKVLVWGNYWSEQYGKVELIAQWSAGEGWKEVNGGQRLIVSHWWGCDLPCFTDTPVEKKNPVRQAKSKKKDP